MHLTYVHIVSLSFVKQVAQRFFYKYYMYVFTFPLFLANALITQMKTEALKTRDPVFSGSVLQCLSSSSAILSRIVCILSSTKEVSSSKSSSSRKEEGNKSCRSWRASIKVGFSSNQRARTAQVARTWEEDGTKINRSELGHRCLFPRCRKKIIAVRFC